MARKNSRKSKVILKLETGEEFEGSLIPEKRTVKKGFFRNHVEIMAFSLKDGRTTYLFPQNIDYLRAKPGSEESDLVIHTNKGYKPLWH